jgi:hypothetical protein
VARDLLKRHGSSDSVECGQSTLGRSDRAGCAWLRLED